VSELEGEDEIPILYLLFALGRKSGFELIDNCVEQGGL